MNSQMYRDYCIDALKMLLIVLVIYGHIPLLDGLINEGVSIECDSITLKNNLIFGWCNMKTSKMETALCMGKNSQLEWGGANLAALTW